MAAHGLADETIGRGPIALPAEGGVFLSWRLLAEDPQEIGFHLERVDGNRTARLTDAPLASATCFHDPAGTADCRYTLLAVSGGETVGEVTFAPEPEPYLSIPLQRRDGIAKIAIADLTGDGVYDYVVKSPGHGIDPGTARRSSDAYRLEAYDGRTRKLLWTYDLGWNMNMGIWWTPVVAADLDGDGRAEVVLKTAPHAASFEDSLAERDGPAEGFVLRGPEYLSVLDGRSGRELARVDWIERGAPEAWGDNRGNRVNRNQIGLARLDGKRPGIIAVRGTYTRMIVHAWDFTGGRLQRRWIWDGDENDPPIRGQGSHGMQCADIDGDGRDEIILGSVALDDDGSTLWCNGMGHPDILYLGEMVSGNPGLEVAFGYETRQRRNGIHVADARTGLLLWGHDRPTTHIHDQGMLADFLPENPGMEFYAVEKDRGDGAFLYAAADGKLLGETFLGSLSPRPVWWLDGPQKVWSPFRGGRRDGFDLIRGLDERVASFPGTMIAIADVLGDWREEMLVSLPGELRVYSTTVPATTRRVCLMQDPLYRSNVAHQAMGYFYPPQLSRAAGH